MHIYTITYNEEKILPYFINHYRALFNNCQITVYDNESTDNTVKIAKENNCEVITYKTNNQLNDTVYLEIKNNSWKKSSSDWIIVADADEFLKISEDDLQKEKSTIIKTQGYSMVSKTKDWNPPQPLPNIGLPDNNYSKYYCFNKNYITEIKYKPGCHLAEPTGKISFSDKIYPAYHYHFLNYEDTVKKYKRNSNRLSKENLKNKHGVHYKNSDKKILARFENHIKHGIILF